MLNAISKGFCVWAFPEKMKHRFLCCLTETAKISLFPKCVILNRKEFKDVLPQFNYFSDENICCSFLASFGAKLPRKTSFPSTLDK